MATCIGVPDIDPETSAMHTRRERPTGLLAPMDTASAARASAATLSAATPGHS